MKFEHGYITDIYFESLEELKKGLSLFMEQLPSGVEIYEFNLRLHWTPDTLNTQSLVECRHFINAVSEKYQSLPIYIEFPFCTDKKAQYASFPDCDQCVFFEADWCRWPRQMGRHYTNLQKPFLEKDFDNLNLNSFEKSSPTTWFIPKRDQIVNSAHQLRKSPHVFDFGAGNGFVTFLIHRELSESHKTYAIDPFVKTQLDTKNLFYKKSLPDLMPENWSLISSLGDYHVPFEKCLQKNTLPRDVIFFRFPSVFGNPGMRTRITYKGGKLIEQQNEKLFDINMLFDLGYNLILKEPVPSASYDDTELLIYSRVEKKFDSTQVSKPYHWESGLTENYLKSLELKNSTISTESLL